MKKQKWDGGVFELGRQLNIKHADALALRKQASVLQSWHELLCGREDGVCVEYDEETERYFKYRYDTMDGYKNKTVCRDREKTAVKHISTILKKYEGLCFYIQSDPRGAPLFIYKRRDLHEQNEAIECCYNSVGVPVGRIEA